MLQVQFSTRLIGGIGEKMSPLLVHLDHVGIKITALVLTVGAKLVASVYMMGATRVGILVSKTKVYVASSMLKAS
jgi:hypothetical protein